MKLKSENTEFYEDWKNETISFQSSFDKFDPEIKTQKGSRLSFKLDVSKKYYFHLQNIRLELIENGAIKDRCISCKSVDTKFNESIWTCNKCKQKWHPLKLLYRGLDDTKYE